MNRGTKIEIWDTTDPIAEEYFRACEFFVRAANDPWGVSTAFKCEDTIHVGSVAVTSSTHIFLNELCHPLLSGTS